MLEALEATLREVVFASGNSSNTGSNSGGGQNNPRLAVSSSSYQTFYLTLVINLAICLVSFFLFCLLRTRVKTLYSYKLSKYFTRRRSDRSKLFELDDIDDEESRIVDSFNELDKQREGLSESMFGWVSSVFKYPDTKVLESQGIDALMLLRAMKMMMLIIGIAMVYGLAVLLTINYKGPFKSYPESNPLRPNDLDLFTLSNVAPGSQLMWFHVVGVYLVTFITLIVLYRNYTQFVLLREQWRSAPEPRNFVVQLTGFEPESNEESLAETIKTLLNINIEPVHVTLVRQLPSRLTKLLEKRKKAIRLLERAKLELNMTEKRPTIKLPKHTDLNSLLSPMNQPINYSELDSDEEDDFDEEYEAVVEGSEGSQQLRLPPRRDPAKVNGYRTSGVFLWPVMGCCMKLLKKTKVKCDAISYYAARLERINFEITQLQSQYQTFINNDIAFVHCPSILHAAKLGMCQIERNSDKWRTKMAGNPGDINWNSIVHHHYPRSHQRWLNAFVWIAVVLLVGVWAIPVTFVISFTQFDNLKNLPLLSKVIPGLCDSVPLVCSLIQGYLPSLALVILTALVPYMIEYMLKLVRHVTYTNRERSLLQKYFVWLCVNIFFVVTATGTFYEVLWPAIDDPKILVDMLASSIPSSSSFYIYYLITQGLGVAFFTMLRPWDLITMGFWKMKPKTDLDKKEFREQKAHTCLRYSTLIPQILTAFLLTMIYSCISPLILPFGFLYMISLFFVTKYYIIYEHIPKWPFGGGEIFQDIYGIIIAVLLLMQVTMFGVFGLKKFTAGVIMMAILPLITAVFHSTITSKYRSSVINPSLFRLYERIEKEPIERYEEAFLSALVAYRQPSINPSNGIANPTSAAPLLRKDKQSDTEGVGVGLGDIVTATDIHIGDR